MRSFRLLLVLVVPVMLLGCNFSIRAPGVWYGVATDVEGNVFESVMFINEEGRVSVSLNNGLFMTAEGYFKDQRETTDIYANALSNFESPDFFSINSNVKVEIVGELGDQEGNVEIRIDNAPAYSLSLLRNADAVASQEQFSGSWRVNPDDPNSANTWTISDEGVLEGQDLFGCNYLGFLEPEAMINLANITLVIDSCDYAGVYDGIMSLFTEASTGRVGVFYMWSNGNYIFVNGLEKIINSGS